MGAIKPKWTARVNVKFRHRPGRGGLHREISDMFGLAGGIEETLYEDFELSISPGEIVAIVGPSGSGKTVLLKAMARRVGGDVVWLDADGLAREPGRVIDLLGDGPLGQRLEVLSRCGLAEAALLVSPCKCLSGGQRHRLALARALHEAAGSGRERLILADEFAATLDWFTAGVLARQVRKMVATSGLALMLATPREEILPALQPDRVIVKPLGGPARLVQFAPGRRRRPGYPAGFTHRRPRWAVRPGSIGDYDLLGRYHYRGGRPAAHKRVYTIRPPRLSGTAGLILPPVAGVIVVSPPLLCVRSRNIVTGGRYSVRPRKRSIARLNREVESISRVVVHPMFRGMGLAVRLVRHILRTSPAAVVEALAVMGKVHPFFELAGMMPCYGGGGELDYVYYDHWKAARAERRS